RAARRRRGPTPPASTRSARPAARPRRRRRCPAPSLRWPGAARSRRSSGRWRGAEGRRDLAELASVVEVVQAREQQRLAPVERAEEGVFDRDVQAPGGIGGAHAVEQGLPLATEDLEPRVSRAERRVLDPAALTARGRRQVLEDR